MKTDLSPDTDVSLLPRADLPVIWDSFRAKAELVRATAETLTVTRIDQKEEMALARTTRLTLREIRIAVESKRKELCESHIRETKKVNGAANAIEDFIKPLEARLLIQESFAEQHEVLRIAELSKSRNAELSSVRPGTFVSNAGNISQADYDAYIARLRDEQAELEAANRLRIEAERKLAEQAIEMVRQQEAFLTNAKALKVAEDARQNAQRAEWAEQDRQRADAARAEENAKLEAQRKEAEALAAERAAQHRLEREEYELKAAAAREVCRIERERLDEEKAIRDADLAEQKRIRDEQFAKLEAELAQANAAKVAEEARLRKLAVAPDVEKLRDYYERLRGVKCPVPLATPEARECFEKVVVKFNDMASIINEFCQK